MKPERTFTRLTAADASVLLQTQAHVFDARDERSFAASHIDGAILLDSGSLNALLFGTPKHGTILIYCYHGNASQTYGQMFADFGFKHVHDLIGGYEAWQRYVNSVTATKTETLSPQLRDWLVAEGFTGNLDTTIANATTPLMHAARHGSVSMVRELISLKAALDPLNLDDYSALDMAANVECLRLLRPVNPRKNLTETA